jgi:hypothetical protein
MTHEISFSFDTTRIDFISSSKGTQVRLPNVALFYQPGMGCLAWNQNE